MLKNMFVAGALLQTFSWWGGDSLSLPQGVIFFALDGRPDGPPVLYKSHPLTAISSYAYVLVMRRFLLHLCDTITVANSSYWMCILL